MTKLIKPNVSKFCLAIHLFFGKPNNMNDFFLFILIYFIEKKILDKKFFCQEKHCCLQKLLCE